MDFFTGIDAAAIFFIVIVGLAITTIFKGVKIVAQGMEFPVERFGKYTKTLKPGLHLIVPYVDRVAYEVNMRERVMDVPSQEIITKDNAMVKVDGVVFFQVLDAAGSSYEVNDLENATLNLTMTNIRTDMGSMDLDELLSQRDKINSQLLTVVDEATNPWGVKVTRIEIKDISPPRDLVESMGRQMKAERDKRANILEAEGFRQAKILKAEGEKQSAILDAEGRREAAYRDAEAREREGEAEAKVTEVVSAAIESGNIQAINYFIAQKYVEAFGEIASAPNQKVLILPMEATALLGSLSGIAEIAKEAFGTGDSNASDTGRTGATGATGPWNGLADK